MQKRLAILLLLSSVSAQAQTLVAQSLVFQFNRSGTSEIRDLMAGTWQLLPGHPWESQEFAFGVQSDTRPAGAKTQVMSFWFRSNGYFSSNPGDSDHLALMLKGTWRKGFIQGRGFIIGGNSPWVPSGLDPSSTFEVWDYTSPSGGHVWMDRYQNGLQDYTWYQVTLSVDSGSISYEIRDINGRIVNAQSVADTYYPNLPDLGGWFILATNSSHTTNWSINFSDVAVGWH